MMREPGIAGGLQVNAVVCWMSDMSGHTHLGDFAFDLCSDGENVGFKGSHWVGSMW